ncbi:MAG TPA: sortase [Candidatus Paceibacterota bacterium]|jgi:LPXTG-site transpeptidase (sortase) family protein|nr:sortase [Candidatus Paceibacterota bacterium]
MGVPVVKTSKQWYKFITAMRFFPFAVTFVVLFGITYLFLGMVDALPNPPADADTPAITDTTNSTPQTIADGTAELPVRVVAKDIGLDSKVVNPQATDIDTLNKAVDEAAMRYPDSSKLGAEGTVLLFGHSSYLPIVHNQVYKTFNGIQNLKNGQTISVYSAGTEYRYSVTGVRLANAQEDVVELPATGKHLTLVTCDSFGTKSDRFVVTADFTGAYAL